MNELQNRFRPQLERLDDRIVPAHGGIGQANFGNLISALNNVAVQVDHVEALKNFSISDIQVVNVDVDNVLNNSVNHNRIIQDVLNHSVNQNQVLTDFLNQSLNQNVIDILHSADFLNNNVVAVNVLSGGTVVLFTAPPT